MSAWKELPRPLTPGPWEHVYRDAEFAKDVVNAVAQPDNEMGHIADVPYWMTEDARAIAALPDYVAEVDRLRAWVDWLSALCWGQEHAANWPIKERIAIRAGEWPEESKP